MVLFSINKRMSYTNRIAINYVVYLLFFPIVLLFFCSSNTGDVNSNLEPDTMKAGLKNTANLTKKNPVSLLTLKEKVIEKGKNPVLVSARSNSHFSYQKWLKSDMAFLGKPYSRRISEYDKIIKKMARRYGFDWRLVAAQIYVESNFKSKAQSGVGAIGLMQVMPRTAKFMGFDPSCLVNPDINISVGCMYDQRMYSLWGKQKKDYNRLAFALASYNAGRGRVLRSYSTENNRTTWESVHQLLPEETQLYVHKIYLKHDFYKRCLLP